MFFNIKANLFMEKKNIFFSLSLRPKMRARKRMLRTKILYEVANITSVPLRPT